MNQAITATGTAHPLLANFIDGRFVGAGPGGGRMRKPALQLSKAFPNIEVEDSCAIQNEVTLRKIAGGRRLIDHMRSGPFTRPVWADKGDTLHADIEPLGAVAVQIT